MSSNKQAVDWRNKVNPLFVLAVQCLRLMPRLFMALAEGGLDSPQVRAVMVEACHESLLLLPAAPPEQINELTSRPKENELFGDPVIGSAIREVVAAVRNVPEAVITNGFEESHWWMTQKSWTEFLREPDMVESMLNALSLLQLKTPLRELTRRVATDTDLYERLFQSANKLPGDLLPNRLLEKLTDHATRIVGRALLLKGDPVGYQLPLRAILFFGWDFGLRDLSIPELHSFLVQMQIVPNFYGPETLRRYRDRLRRMIKSMGERDASIEPNRTDIALPSATSRRGSP